MINQLEFFKGRKLIGVAELAAAAERILETTNTQQERGSVREYPDERTVRFYLSEGLLPPSPEKQGTALVFGYIHLLALLTVKKLQSESLPIRKIREIITGRNENELEKILGVNKEEDYKDKNIKKSKNEAQAFLETLLLESSSPMRELDDERPHFSRISHPAPASHPSASSRQQHRQTLFDTEEGESWKRFKVAEGLEVHIEEIFKLPSDFKEQELLVRKIRQLIHSAGRR